MLEDEFTKVLRRLEPCDRRVVEGSPCIGTEPLEFQLWAWIQGLAAGDEGYMAHTPAQLREVGDLAYRVATEREDAERQS